MKIGILTFHRAKNYGAVLQAYSLLYILKGMGIDSSIIDRYQGEKSFIHKIYHFLHPRFFRYRFIWKQFDDFSKSYLQPKTKSYHSEYALSKFSKENFDAVIVGSDQVWRMEFSSIGYNYFFDFIKDSKIKKIAYAASFGKSNWQEPENVTSKVRTLLSSFSAISVREESGVDICSNVFGVQAIHVLDPTLLMKKEDYDFLFLKDIPIAYNNYIVSYMLGINTDQLQYCNAFAKENSLSYMDLYYIYPSDFLKCDAGIFGESGDNHISVKEWLSQIRNAKYIVTNSFHATVFSILFGKKFVVVNHESGGTSRITSLLNFLGLEKHFINNLSELSMTKLNQEINYDEVYSILDKERLVSLDFLKKSIYK